jgi:hypothetical protein
MLKSSLRSFALAALPAAALLVAMPASATTVLSVGGGWSGFSFGGVGSSWSDDFSFTLTGTAELRVTDAFLSGDQFKVTLNGVDYNTSAPGSTGDDISSNYDGAFADSRWSSRSWTLGPGNYTVSGTTLLSPFGAGGAAIELVSSAVPEPTTWALMIMGFGAVGVVARRRRAMSVA